MKKAVIFSILALLPVFAFSQNALTIDAALSNSTSYFSGRIPSKTKVVVLNFSSKWPDLSEYIIEELIGYIVNEGKLTVVDRQNLETIRREMDFQLSGEVSDETAQSIGKKLGAQTIMSGSITAIGNSYRLRIRAISVETAEILGMQNVDVAQDSRIAALTGTAYTGPAVVATTTAPRAAASAESVSDSKVVLQLVTLDGVWQYGTNGGIHTINGSTGVFTQLDPDQVWKHAVSKGIVKVGDPVFRNLTKTSDLTWKGEVFLRKANGNFATGMDWANCTINLRPDGKTFQLRFPGGSQIHNRRQ
jgi:TolB-like protein